MDIGNGFLYVVPQSDNCLSNSFSSFIKNISLNMLNENTVQFSTINKTILEKIKNDIKSSDREELLVYQNIKIFDKTSKYNLIISKQLIKPYDELNIQPFLLIGHRGCGSNLETSCNNKFEENTIDSFNQAHIEGADMVELDVHLTKDGCVVVYHNDYISNKRICDLYYQEFLLLMNNKNEFANKPTSFSKILDALDDTIGINVEIKNCNLTDNTYLPKLIQSVWKIIVEKNQNRIFIFSSFSPMACIYTKILSSNTNVFLLLDVHDEKQDNSENDKLVKFCQLFDLTGFVVSSDYFEKHSKKIKKLMVGNKRVFCYGKYTNNIIKSEELIRCGISGLITDNLSIYKDRRDKLIKK